MAIICKYKFNSTLCADYLPEFNTEFTGYTKTDVDNGDNTITRTIEHDTLKPTLIRFGNSQSVTDRERSLLELIECNTANVTNMDSMFFGCTLLTSLNLSNFDTSKVTNMSAMFYNCNKLTSLDLSSFNTSKVTNMNSMFNGCKLLTSLDLSNFNTIKVNNMGYMFSNCNKLTSLNLSNFNTSNVISMLGMFRTCSSLTSLDVSNFNTINVTNMSYMFYDCTSLSDIGMVYCNKATIDKVSLLIQHTANIYVNSVIPDDCTPVDGITFIFDGDIKTLYLNSPLLEGDTIEEKDGGIYHVHRYGKIVFDGSDDERWGMMSNWDNYFEDTLGYKRFQISVSNLYFNNQILSTISDKFASISNANWKTLSEHIENDEKKINIVTSKATTVDEFKSWLQQNPVTAVYKLAEPQYELIEQSNLTIPSYTNGHLDLTSAVPVEKVDFLPFSEELTYLYPSTSYTVQFVSDRETLVDLILGGTSLLAQSIVVGLNRISITTPSELVDNKLVINGTGAKISQVVVTNTDREFDYFEGMKSVGECEGNVIEIVSQNKNLIDINRFKPSTDKGTVSIDGDVITFNYKGSYPTLRHTFTQKEIDLLKGKTFKFGHGGITDTVENNRLNIRFVAVVDGVDNYYSFPSTESYTRMVTLPDNMEELEFSIVPNNTSNSNIQGTFTISNIQLLFADTENTDYTPHQSNTQQLTHEPLRAVGEDVKDRYVLIDGKWYIERNCGSISFNEIIDNIVLGDDNKEKTIRFKWKTSKIPNMKPETGSNFYCNNFKYAKYSDDIEGIDIGKDLDCNILRSKLQTQDINGFKQWVENNPTTLIYELATPTYEPIDYNPLEVYSDVTHITTNSTIPCNVIVKNHGYNLVALKENTQYTLYVNKDTTNALTYRLGDYIEVTAPSKFTFTTPETLTDKTLRIDGKGAKVNDLMLIEGTPTNDSIGYFDGLKSSYECEQVTDENDENYGKYKVDIKVVGKNLFDGETRNGYYSSGVFKANANNLANVNPIRIKPNTSYVGSGDAPPRMSFYDKDMNFILNSTSTCNISPSNACYMNIHAYGATWFQIEEGDTATEYEPYFESTQTIYLNSPLLKGDEIVWKDNKIQHYHKMGRIVLDGSDDEGWDLNKKYSKGGQYVSYASVRGIKPKSDLTIYCDKIKYIGEYNGINDCIWAYNDASLVIQNSTIETLEDFRQWLQANPTTVVYELKTPYYEEISDYPLKLNVIANSSLSTESTIQVTNISFNIYEETLPYLYPNTKYYITFNSDVDRKNIIIDLGGSHVVFNCKVGFNKVEITTPSDTTNLLTFSGTGVNIDHVKATQQDIDEYFEGMKSVGECEELEITSANSDNTLLNTQQLTHEPLRAVGDAKDRYVLIDGKWYIERKCKEMIITSEDISGIGLMEQDLNNGYERYSLSFHSMTNYRAKHPYQKLLNNSFYSQVGWKFEGECMFLNEDNSIGLILNKNRNIGNNHNKLREFLTNNPVKFIYELASPIYEEIDYNPFETYSDITHISANSLIPTNVVVKNHGYNCILKPSTTYTVALNKPNGTISAKLGGSSKVDSTNSIFTITTPSTLSDDVLRLSGNGKVKDIMILEGDKTVNTPSYFEGIESVFEQEYDTEKCKYRVTARVEGNGKESSITFYLNEPLRGTGTAKDKVFIQDSKVVVQRNCGSVTFDGSEGIRINSINDKTIEFHIHDSINKTINNIICICNTIPYKASGTDERVTPYVTGIYVTINKNKLNTQDVEGFKQWLQDNPTTIVYQLAEPTYEEADCDSSKLVLENYENSSLIFESNIPVSANIRYSGEVPVVTQAKSLSSKVDNTTLDINENIIPYMCDIDYRIVELQLMNGDTQGEGIELLGIGDIEILGNENVLFNNREDKKYNYSYDMLKRDILSQRYSKEEYRYRLDRYLLANKISNEEYKELEGLLNNGK